MCYRLSFFFFFNDTATTEIYTLSLHDALPISASLRSDRSLREVLPFGRDQHHGGQRGRAASEDRGAEAALRRWAGVDNRRPPGGLSPLVVQCAPVQYRTPAAPERGG